MNTKNKNKTHFISLQSYLKLWIARKRKWKYYIISVDLQMWQQQHNFDSCINILHDFEVTCEEVQERSELFVYKYVCVWVCVLTTKQKKNNNNLQKCKKLSKSFRLVFCSIPPAFAMNFPSCCHHCDNIYQTITKAANIHSFAAPSKPIKCHNKQQHGVAFCQLSAAS